MNQEEIKRIILKAVEELETQDKRGARWDHLVEKLTERGLGKNEVDEIVTEMLDDGLLYEPRIGRIQLAKSRQGLFNW